MTNEQFDSNEFFKLARKTLARCSKHIRDIQLLPVHGQGYNIKEGVAVVTPGDHKSQEIGMEFLLPGARHMAINPEEGKTIYGDPDSELALYFDPIDGSRPFATAKPTSTVILGVYDRANQEILGAATMEPVRGLMWFSSLDEGTYLNRFDYDDERWVHSKHNDGRGLEIHVNPEKRKGEVISIDATTGFNRPIGDGKFNRVLTDEERIELTRQLRSRGYTEDSAGSNGAHFGYTALSQGPQVGCITTAIGGPFDILGMLHVTEAGGLAAAYQIERNEFEEPALHMIGTNIEDADYAIAANNSNVLSDLRSSMKTLIL